MTWGGLRGAVGIALAIYLEEQIKADDCLGADGKHVTCGHSSADADRLHVVGPQVTFVVGMFSALTLVINGSSSRWVLQTLGMIGPRRALCADGWLLVCWSFFYPYLVQVLQTRGMIGPRRALCVDSCVPIHLSVQPSVCLSVHPWVSIGVNGVTEMLQALCRIGLRPNPRTLLWRRTSGDTCFHPPIHPW